MGQTPENTKKIDEMKNTKHKEEDTLRVRTCMHAHTHTHLHRYMSYLFLAGCLLDAAVALEAMDSA